MSIIYFIRHGQASFGSDNYDRLSEAGRSQCQVLGEFLARRGMSFDAAYCGDQERQIHTGRIVLGNLAKGAGPDDLIIDKDFNEYNSFDVLTKLLPRMIEDDPALAEALPTMYDSNRNFQRVYEKGMIRWISGRYDMEGMPTWRGFHQRVQGAIRRVMGAHAADAGAKVAVFTSGGPISSVMNMALGLADEVTLRITWQVVNSSVTACKFKDDSFFLWIFNSIAHLEKREYKSLITYR